MKYNTVSTSAITYSSDTDVSFTFNPSISIALSSVELRIPNLTPGTTANSNTITITAASNNITGYTLMASVGNNTHTNPSYNNTRLNHVNETNYFSSIATSASIAAITTDNTWGYASSLDNGATWSNYSGLPLYSTTPKTLMDTNTNGTSNLEIKIGAKASASQPSGEYNNVINFIAVGNADITDGCMEIYSALTEDLVSCVPLTEVTKTSIDNVNTLDDESKESFIEFYENIKAIEYKEVVSFFWMSLPNRYKSYFENGDYYAKYEFTSSGENVELIANENNMEVVHIDGEEYFAKLTELGAIAILIDQ